MFSLHDHVPPALISLRTGPGYAPPQLPFNTYVATAWKLATALTSIKLVWSVRVTSPLSLTLTCNHFDTYWCRNDFAMPTTGLGG